MLIEVYTPINAVPLYSYTTFASDKVLDKSVLLTFLIETHIKEQTCTEMHNSKSVYDLYCDVR